MGTIPPAGDTPPNMPEIGPIVAKAVFPLVQVPPVIASTSVIVPPGQASEAPAINGGVGSTVTTTEAPQPTLYSMVSTPADSPVTSPEKISTIAMVVLLLDQ